MFIGIHDGGIIMKKLFMILLVTIIAASGCTRLPASTETGVKPGEYEGSISSENLRAENKTLKENLDKAQGELEKIKNDYLNLAKNNDLSVEKLSSLNPFSTSFRTMKCRSSPRSRPTKLPSQTT
jgi:hypothetical protein